MREYEVEIEIGGFAHVTVDARNAADAESKAYQLVMDHIDAYISLEVVDSATDAYTYTSSEGVQVKWDPDDRIIRRCSYEGEPWITNGQIIFKLAAGCTVPEDIEELTTPLASIIPKNLVPVQLKGEAVDGRLVLQRLDGSYVCINKDYAKFLKTGVDLMADDNKWGPVAAMRNKALVCLLMPLHIEDHEWAQLLKEVSDAP